ncbi:MAG: radical SAM family heme chaperone HemW [Oscillospiraceae bacterium]|nr:radical SAM family heme chaperone HemW [Oscillospiraceae bacterium]
MKKTLRPLGLYIHIPFCAQKCVYCDFYSLPDAAARMDDYCAALCAHIEETAATAKNHAVDTIYFGGGTPTFFGAARLIRILRCIEKKYTVAKDAEITFEANPESAREAGELKRLRRAGFNRISLGMQSASDEMLQTLGRIHSAEDVKDAVAAARKAKIRNVSLDLIYGLPSQTMEGWLSDLGAAIALAPEHISCYGLKVEEGTPLWRDISRYTLPDDDAQADFYLAAVESLEKNGYRQYEISNFAKEGSSSRHNYKYWTLGEYAGFGPGAHSDFGGVRYAYVRDLAAYIDGVARGTDIIAEREVIDPRDRDTEYLMLGLRTGEGICPAEFERRYRYRFAPLVPLLERYADEGYAVLENDRWHLTPKGFLVSNQIIGALLQAHGDEKARRAEAAAHGDFRIV